MTDRDGYVAAVALIGARLGGDQEGQCAITGDCRCECRPLADGLTKVAEIMIRTMAREARMPPGEAADQLGIVMQRIARERAAGPDL